MAFVPRLSPNSPSAMQGNAWWYSNGNTYYSYGAGLPNCTCYCFGRTGEIDGAFNYDLPQYNNGGEWYDVVSSQGIIPVGATPALGGIMVFKPYPTSTYLGHCATVEDIDSNGVVTISNSGYPSNYFWTEQLYPNTDPALNYVSQWMIDYGYYYQGCIYAYQQPPVPPTPVPSDGDLPFWMLLRYGF